jgi:hypothetical protein
VRAQPGGSGCNVHCTQSHLDALPAESMNVAIPLMLPFANWPIVAPPPSIV